MGSITGTNQGRELVKCPQADVLPQCVKGVRENSILFFDIGQPVVLAEFEKEEGKRPKRLNELDSEIRGGPQFESAVSGNSTAPERQSSSRVSP